MEREYQLVLFTNAGARADREGLESALCIFRELGVPQPTLGDKFVGSNEVSFGAVCTPLTDIDHRLHRIQSASLGADLACNTEGTYVFRDEMTSDHGSFCRVLPGKSISDGGSHSQ